LTESLTAEPTMREVERANIVVEVVGGGWLCAAPA
jgi:hypothetical protein